MQRNEPSAINRANQDRLACLLLALITLFLYWPARHFEFNNYDDAQYLTTNPQVQSGLTWTCVKWAFTTGYACNWHPLTWLSHALDYQIYGANAGGHHLTGVLFHVANTVLLFLLLRQLTGAFWRCVVVSALFAWHPMHVESVAWVAERKDVLSTFFGFLTLLSYTAYIHQSKIKNQKSKIYHGLTLVFFALGLMSKPMLVSLPLLLLLLDFWPLNRVSPNYPAFNLRLWIALALEKIPFFILSAASCVVTFLIQQHGHAVQSLQKLSFHERIANAVVAYFRYIEKLIYPAKLSVIYPYTRDLPMIEITTSAGLLVLLCWSAWRVRRSHPWWAVGWIWFVVTLVPVIGLVQVGAQSMADRYTYLPGIGLFIAFAWEANLNRHAWLREPLRWLTIPALAGCLVVSSHQISYWRNSETLFSHAVAVTKDNAIAECNLSAALMDQRRKAEALVHLKEALRIDPDYVQALNNMGVYLADAGQRAEAEDYFKAVLRQQPDYAPAHFQLGLLLYHAGKVNDAVAAFRSAIRSDPAFDKPHANLGIILSSQGRMDEAVAELQQALACQPRNAHAHNGLGRILEARGQWAEASAHYFAAIEAEPDFADAHDNLGVALTALGKFAEASEHFQTALKLQPDFPEAHYNFGNALAAQHKLDDAEKQYETALRQKPDYLDAHFNLALVLAQTGNRAGAIQHYRAILQLNPGFIPAMKKLAWLLATSPEADLRDGTESLRLANLAAQSVQPDVETLDALAAAYAESGKFAEAADAARKALNAAQAANHEKYAAQIQERINLYTSGKPFRQPL